MATTAVFATSGKLGTATPTTANTARDGTGALSTIATAGANGTRVDRVEIISSGTLGAASANVLRLFLFDGANAWLFREVAVATFTPSATAAGFAGVFQFPVEHPLVLPNGWSLKCAPHTYAGTVDKYTWTAVGGDL